MDLTQFLKPELAALVAILYVIGIMLKKAQKVADASIPFVLLIIAVPMTLLWAFINYPISTPQEVAVLIYTAIIQAVICVAVAVYVNQMIKQASKTGE